MTKLISAFRPGLKMGMDFRGVVRKRVPKITVFGLKSGQDLENRAAHPYQEFPGVPLPWKMHLLALFEPFYRPKSQISISFRILQTAKSPYL